MKYAEYQIDNNKIEVFNSMLGKEEIVLNGTKVSEKYSFFGADHLVKIGTDDYIIRPHLDFTKLGGISIRIHKNGSPILLKNLLSKKMKNWKAIRYVLGILLGIYVGYKFGYLISDILFH